MIALYKGKSALSTLIRIFTWSEYSHAAWVDDDTWETFQAWRHGVTTSPSIHEGHKPGTPVDIFEVAGEDRCKRSDIRSFIETQRGKGYDMPGILGIVIRRDRQDQERWFCSELVFAAYAHVGLPLLSRVPAHKVFPGLLALSPLLEYSFTTFTMP